MINIDLFKRDPKERKAYADGFKAGAEVAIRDGCEQALKIWEILNTDTAYQKIEALPSAQPEQLGTDLAEVGTDMISRQAALDALDKIFDSIPMEQTTEILTFRRALRELPSAQPEIIRCKDCKHWTQSTGKMTGYGLGRCDFHDADLVACNGFCYWAERRTDEAD